MYIYSTTALISSLFLNFYFTFLLSLIIILIATTTTANPTALPSPNINSLRDIEQANQPRLILEIHPPVDGDSVIVLPLTELSDEDKPQLTNLRQAWITTKIFVVSDGEEEEVVEGLDVEAALVSDGPVVYGSRGTADDDDDDDADDYDNDNGDTNNASNITTKDTLEVKCMFIISPVEMVDGEWVLADRTARMSDVFSESFTVGEIVEGTGVMGITCIVYRFEEGRGRRRRRRGS